MAKKKAAFKPAGGDPNAPRKPAEFKRSEQLAIRVTPSEAAAIRANAAAAGLPLNWFMIQRCTAPGKA